MPRLDRPRPAAPRRGGACRRASSSPSRSRTADGELCELCLWIAESPAQRRAGADGRHRSRAGRRDAVPVYEPPRRAVPDARLPMPLSIALFGPDGSLRVDASRWPRAHRSRSRTARSTRRPTRTSRRSRSRRAGSPSSASAPAAASSCPRPSCPDGDTVEPARSPVGSCDTPRQARVIVGDDRRYTPPVIFALPHRRGPRRAERPTGSEGRFNTHDACVRVHGHHRRGRRGSRRPSPGSRP